MTSRTDNAFTLRSCIILFFIVIVAAIVLPVLLRSRENPNRPRAFCQGNLRAIGICCKIFADENNGQMPESFRDLKDLPQKSDGSSIFICEESSDKVGDSSAIDSWSSYEIVYHGKLIDDKNLVIVQEKNDHAHRPGGRNYLFGDGHVAFRRIGAAAPKAELEP